jgi:two-component system cell cycle sensor histidine kinase/response regulator CckA
MRDYRLSDLLDLNIIQKMADAHYRAAGMPIGIIDAIDGAILVGAGWQDICLKFHRANPRSLQLCRESDNYIKDHLVEGEACSYKCKNGLWDIGVPIVVAGRHLATLFLGQFFYEGEVPDRAFFARSGHEFGFDVSAYLEALGRVPVFSREQVDYILEYNKALVGFIADLAERSLVNIQTTEKIRESERKLHAIFNQSYQYLGMLSIDGRLLQANQTALRFGNIQEAEVIGKFFWETPWWTHAPEQQAKVRTAIQKAATGEFVRFEATHRAADGNLHYIDFSIKPVMDDAGKTVLLIPEGRDISERKRVEVEVKRQAMFLQILIDAMPYPIFYKDRQGRYLGCNRAFERFHGLSSEQLAGKTVYDIAAPELAQVFDEADKDLFLHPGTQIYEAGIKTSDGERHEVIFHKATFEGPDGELAGLVGTIVDITERKRAEKERQTLQDQLAAVRRMESIGRLAGGVAHDFNNMLGVILGNVELVLATLDPAQPLWANLEEIRKAAEHSADLTRQLLAFARKQTVSPRVLDLNQTVDSMLTMLRRLVGEDIELAWMPGFDIWSVRIDPAQIDQILINLAANARDSIAGVGKVSLNTKNIIADEAYCRTSIGLTPGAYVRLTVSDNGCGMDGETRTNIFEPFFTTKQQGKGTGLGLATVYGIVKQNHGVINVYSEPGEGTTFKIYLPRHESQGIQTSARAEAALPIGGSETVLLVEDEPMLLELTQIMLTTLGYAVLTAATPSEAIRLVRSHSSRIHLLITDVVMPEMNGRDLAGQLNPHCPQLKQLFMSGYTADVIAHHGVLDEGVHFIQKPFSLKDLAAKVREALDAGQQTR